jgi:hypothetical protein
MGIKQFNGSYDQKEDRLLFRFNTQDDQEIRFWLTRFITKGILGAVDHLIQRGLEQKHNPQIAEVIKEFQKEGVAKTTNVNENYLGAATYPLGEEPTLVTAMNFNLTGDVFSMDFKLPDNRNLNIKLPTASVQSMALLLRKLCEKAQWGAAEWANEVMVVKQSSAHSDSNGGLMH